MSDPSAPTLVLVHGAGHTSVVWRTVQVHLRHPSLAVDLPGRRDRPGDLTTVTIDHAARSIAHDVSDATQGRVVLVGHSVAGIVLPALAGSEASIYQYFEPFGTVFFLADDVVLWAIAGTILLASVVVPRFYCRYACPLGASLAVASLISLKRIPRVEQCDYCKVCEKRCPTGAIDGPHVDFKECVRCNDCEVQLIERTGVCRHDMETIRPRLVQLRARGAAGAAGAAASSN